MTAGDDIRADAGPTEVAGRMVPRRLVVLLPVTLFAVLAGLLAWGLTRNVTEQALNETILPLVERLQTEAKERQP